MAKGWPGEPQMESDVLVAEGNAAGAAGKPIHDVIFDFGNVLVYWDPANTMVGRYSRESIEWFLDDANSGLYAASDLMDGGATCKEAEDWVLANRGERAAEMIRYYNENFVDSLGGAVPGARKLIEDLKAAGIGVWGLSNWSAELFPIASKGYPILHTLDGKVVSGPIGLRKPHTDIYEYALRQFGIEASGAVFVDDKAMNIVGANSAGIRGIKFTDPYKLRALLIDAGIDIPAVK
ncbi:HAD family hydrolase [Bifidobacterium vespertilionis]|uniref:HAD family hydrolase n=1 Tax=Bifidobacterium vespertilionis TaxID=2562524 RepID=UPI001BDDBCCF|nr:HAD family phosphatase [Bifidobacterium vespertilionis]MBT1180115.1 HAD family phosphatase [Bifidobacterium vespertilionis]